MIILKNDEKEFSLVPRTRKVIALTEKLNAKNLNDLIFKSANEVNIKVLAEIILEFAEDQEHKNVFSSIDSVYEFIDKWMAETQKSYKELFVEVAKVVNEMGFFKEKMTEEDLAKQMNSAVYDIDLTEMMKTSAQKFVDVIAEEEFKGYKG